MKKLKGPDLKMPELKVPSFVADLYYDLRDRRLLPLVALVLVAIAAAPFLLSDGGEGSKPPRVAPGTAGASNASQLTVVPATPGLRDYRERLRGRSAKDPFQKPPESSDLSDAQLGTKGNDGFEGSEVTSTTSTTTSATDATKITKTTKNEDGVVTTETTTEPTEDPGLGEPGSEEPGGDPATPEITLYTFAIDVRIKKATTAADGKTEAGDPLTRAKVLPPAPLPGDKTQVVTYTGISPKTRNPLFLVSDEVTSIFGEAICLSGDRSCQLVEVEKGMPTTFVYGPEEARYKITVLKVVPVTAGQF